MPDPNTSWLLAACLVAEACSGCGTGQSEPAHSVSNSSTWKTPMYDRAALVSDFTLLRSAIDEGHPGAYRYVSKPRIDGSFERAAAAIKGPMNGPSFLRVLMPAVAALQDGHTRISLSETDEARFEASAPLLPLRFHVVGGRLFVLYDLRLGYETDTALGGSEVVAIDGRPAARVLQEMTVALEGDGSIPSARIAKLRTFRFNLLHAQLYEPRPTYRLKLRHRRAPVTVMGQPLDDLVKRWAERFPAKASPKPAELEFTNQDRIAVLTIRSFAGPADREGKRDLSAYIPTAFADIRKRGSSSLIIDVRGNGGGKDTLGRILLAHLIDRPFTYYRGLFINARDLSFSRYLDRWPGRVSDEVAGEDDRGRLHLLDHPNLGVHEPATDRFLGKVVILMDGGSFSTTAEFLSLAHYHRLATFIGEEAGGGYYGNTGGVVVTLTMPATRLRLRMPLVRYELAVSGFSPAARSVPPDHAVSPSPSDLIAGLDPAMNLAVRLLSK